MHIVTTCTDDVLPAGSVIEVTKEYKHTYHGWWRSSVGTYKVIVKKKYAEVLEEDEE